MTSVTTIQHPETEALEARVIDLSESFRQYRITNDDDLRKVKETLDVIAEFSGDKELIELSTACSEADSLHHRLVGLRDKVLKPLATLEKYLRGEVASYLDTQERRHKELVAKLQEAANAEHAAVVEELDPWEEPPAPAPATIALAVPKPAVSGLSLRRKPIRAEVYDMKALVAAAAKDDALLQFLYPDVSALTARARSWGKKITEERIPGVRVVDDEKTVSRR